MRAGTAIRGVNNAQVVHQEARTEGLREREFMHANQRLCAAETGTTGELRWCTICAKPQPGDADPAVQRGIGSHATASDLPGFAATTLPWGISSTCVPESP